MEKKKRFSKLNSERITFGRDITITKNEGNIFLKYEKLDVIGSGSFGEVIALKSKITGEIFACKKLIKSQIDDKEKFDLETQIMIQADHPSIIKLYEIYEDKRYVYLVMERCTGGELFDRIIKRIDEGKMYTEKEAAKIFKQIASAVCYCHSKHICHRDLKPENVLLLEDSDDSPLKVIDFGLSALVGKVKMSSRVGTAYYVSPEVLEGNYDEKCDVWSLGVLLYILLSGDPPFNGEDDNEIYTKITQRKFSFPYAEWNSVSEDAKKLITKMLSPPEKRPTAQEVLDDPWVKNSAPNAKGSLKNLKIENLKNYCKSNKLKKAVITFIASRLNEKEVKDLKDIFLSIDANNDGVLTLSEMEQGLKKIKKKHPDFDIEGLFKSIDTDKSGKIDYTEFIAACLDKNVYLKKERLLEAFKMLDKDNSGKISKDEIRATLKTDEMEDAVLENYIKQYDKNNDGEIDYEEFIDMMNDLKI
ncbi:MAG: protein kinase [archaeon]|nr:protein kinase [archaeon]